LIWVGLAQLVSFAFSCAFSFGNPSMKFGYAPFVADNVFFDVRTEIVERLGPQRKPLIISIDGWPGSGKSTFSGWLGWQLAAETIHLDMFLLGNGRLEFSDDLARLICDRPRRNLPVIVEGCGVDKALEKVDRPADFKIFVTETNNSASPVRYKSYFSGDKRREAADFHLLWTMPEPRFLSSDVAKPDAPDWQSNV
jgi:hypothetical protein